MHSVHGSRRVCAVTHVATYFFGSENPLKGLSLNRENVTITHGYEAILMFYGYDLGMDMVSSAVTMPITTTSEPKITENKSVVATTAMPEVITINIPDFNTENSTERNLIKENNVITSDPGQTASPSIMAITTVTPTAVAENKMGTTTETSQITTSSENTTIEATTENPGSSTTFAEEVTSETNEDTTAANPTPGNDVAELVGTLPTEINSMPFQRLQKSRPFHQPSVKLLAPLSSIAIPKHNYLPQHAQLRSGRHKRHLLALKEDNSNLFVTLFSPQHQLHRDLYAISHSGTGTAERGQFTNKYEVETLDSRLLNVANTKSNYGFNTDVISHVFYLGNHQLIHTTFKVYNAVLYFKYFEELKMSALELELDTPEYNLMILLPDDQMDLVAATASLGLAPSLRYIRKQLKPRWVQAIIPDFRLNGIMFLTNDLQNMGVCDIFEPNRADFRPMTEEKGIYVKHIEQSINVNIRTHPINQLKRNYASQTQPIQISVNHPFIFFVIDRDLDVAVMAGRILNPLNVRIQ
ncbi:serpin B10-like [Rhagoletis pomonella]|uniref:serpin B10-like n=1 Tax=Rhagoletis pomonella TaxID=28610 RepID=UPI00177D8ACD|nr:serpin B10-like [Rhagoletis pomonella]